MLAWIIPKLCEFLYVTSCSIRRPTASSKPECSLPEVIKCLPKALDLGTETLIESKKISRQCTKAVVVMNKVTIERSFLTPGAERKYPLHSF